MKKLKFSEAIEEIRKGKKRKFEQSIDLIINLRKFDHRKTPLNIYISLPYKIKEKKICGFIDSKSSLIDVISKTEFSKYKEKKELKKLAKKYDFFIASMQNMPLVASIFGKVLGPAGKMPSPKLGIISQENDKEIKESVDKINSTIKVQTKEPSIKVTIGKESMKNEEIEENFMKVYTTILNELPNKKEQIKSVMIKLTMGKPVGVEV